MYARARFIAALAFFAAGDPSSASGAVTPAPPLETSRRYAAARRIAADAESADAETADRRAFGSDAVFGGGAAAAFFSPPVPSSAAESPPVAFFLARLAASFSRLSLYAAARFIAAAALFACSGVDASNARGASPPEPLELNPPREEDVGTEGGPYPPCGGGRAPAPPVLFFFWFLGVGSASLATSSMRPLRCGVCAMSLSLSAT